VDAFGVTKLLEADAKALSIAGQLTTNTNPPVDAIFTPDKQ
jgi:hypothetical protein